jgi:hypothetical protein
MTISTGRHFAGILSMAAAVAALTAFRAAPVLASGEIALVRATSVMLKDTVRSDGSGVGDTSLTQSAHFLIFIKNIAYAKSVSLWLKNDTAWDSLPCNWVRQADDDNEYWELREDFTPGYGKAPRDLEFKLMYVEGIHTYWDDNGGRNYKLARNGGTLLGKADVLLRKARWAVDTGEAADTSIFSGEVEARVSPGMLEGSTMKVSFTTDYLKTQDIRVIPGPPEPTWRGAPPANDSDKVYRYRFSIAGIRLPYAKNPYLHFHFSFFNGVKSSVDDNLSHQYAIGLGMKLEDLVYDELPNAAGLRYPARMKARLRSQALLKMGKTPVFDLGSRGMADGLGRLR